MLGLLSISTHMRAMYVHGVLVIVCLLFVACSSAPQKALYYTALNDEIEHSATAKKAYYQKIQQNTPQKKTNKYIEKTRPATASRAKKTEDVVANQHKAFNSTNKENNTFQYSPQIPKKIPGHYRPYVVFGKQYYPMFDARGYVETGVASWYGPTFHGKKTSNGETYDMHAETAAHKTLPMGTIVKVTNVENNKSMILRINDRGPFVGDRIIDLSKTAAKNLDILQRGTGMVRVEVVKAPPPLQARHSGEYYVQVGAFSDKKTATSVRSLVEQRGLQTRLIPTSNKKIWKVQVGPMKQFAESTRAKDLLTGDFPESYIVLE